MPRRRSHDDINPNIQRGDFSDADPRSGAAGVGALIPDYGMQAANNVDNMTRTLMPSGPGGGGGGIPIPGFGGGPEVINGIPAGSTVGTNVGIPGASGGSGWASTLAKIFGKGGAVDGTSLALGLMGALSKQPDLFQPKAPYTGNASAQNSLESVLGLTHNAIDGLTSAPPTHLHGVVPEGPGPVSVPGIPFQIGGGMGVDPALRDPSLLTVDNSWLSKFKPAPAAPTSEPKPVARRRPV